MKMSLRNKLLLIVIVPVVICTAVAVITSSLKVYNQGIEGLKDKSNDILSLNIKYFEHIHEDGGMKIPNIKQLKKSCLSLTCLRKMKQRKSSISTKISMNCGLCDLFTSIRPKAAWIVMKSADR